MNKRTLRRRIAAVALAAGTTFGGAVALAAPAHAQPAPRSERSHRDGRHGHWYRVGDFSSPRQCTRAARHWPHLRFRCVRHGHRYRLFLWMYR